MNSYHAFERTIDRAQSLVVLHKTSFPRGRPPGGGEPDDVLRAIVVFSVAAMDSYFHDIIVENAMGVLKHCAKNKKDFPGHLIDAIKPQLTPEKSLLLLYRARPDEELRKIIHEHLAERTFQDPGKIEQGLRIVGIEDVWEPLRKKLNLRSKRKAKEYVLPYIKRRHQIVHEGDLYKSKRFHHKLRPIGRRFADECVKHIRTFVTALHSIISDQLKRKYSI
jgi:hypothetical protein